LRLVAAMRCIASPRLISRKSIRKFSSENVAADIRLAGCCCSENSEITHHANPSLVMTDRSILAEIFLRVRNLQHSLHARQEIGKKIAFFSRNIAKNRFCDLIFEQRFSALL